MAPSLAASGLPVAGAVAVATLAATDPPTGTVQTAATARGGAAGQEPHWQWPLRPAPRVIRGFDPPTLSWGVGHRGVDLAAQVGQPVYPAAAGRVHFAGSLAGHGVVTIVHGGTRTTYMSIRPKVRRGQRVVADTRIGVIDSSFGHCGAAACLHWGLLRGTRYLDPREPFSAGRVRLLPVWALPGGLPVESVWNSDGAAPTRAGDAEGAAGTAGSKPAPSRTLSQDSTVPVSLAGAAAAGGAGMAVLLAFAARAMRRFPPLRRRRLPRGVVDLGRERERRRGKTG